MIWAHDHHNLVSIVQNGELSEHLDDAVTGKKCYREVLQVGDSDIILIRPEEGVGIQNILVGVGKVFRVHTVGNNEGLYVVVESVIGVLSITHDLINRFLDVDSSAFQFDLHEGQSVYKKRYIIAIRVLADNGCLMRYLEDVFGVILVNKGKVDLASVISFKHVFIAQNLCTLKNALAI